MKEFERHIAFYKDYWWAGFSRLIPEPQWGNIHDAHTYLEKYWLPQKEYEKKWKPIQDIIFINQEKSLPELIFSEQYNLLALRGGCLFMEEDFIQLQKCLIALEEKYFVVIENTFGGKQEEPTFKMKFPVNITWNELTSGNYISSIIFEMYRKEYFVFGESGSWGKYAANDYESPLDLIGFKPELGTIFKEYFQQSQEEQNEIYNWLPKSYKDKLIQQKLDI